MKKPESTTRKPPKPPPGLAPEARKLYIRLVEDHDILDPGGLAMAATAAKALDLALELEAEVKANGTTVRDRWGQIKINPALAALRDARHTLLASLRGLGLDIEAAAPPPGRNGR